MFFLISILFYSSLSPSEIIFSVWRILFIMASSGVVETAQWLEVYTVLAQDCSFHITSTVALAPGNPGPLASAACTSVHIPIHRHVIKHGNKSKIVFKCDMQLNEFTIMQQSAFLTEDSYDITTSYPFTGSLSHVVLD